MEYDLESDGKLSGKALPRLSIKDLAAAQHLEELAKAGVDSFKIEGRMRNADYVGIVTGVYRKILDEGPSAGTVDDLLLAFNRGGRFSDHYLRSEKSDSMMTGSETGSHGIYIGDVTAVNARLGIVAYIPKDNTGMPGKGDVISVRRAGTVGEICSAPISGPVISPGEVRIKGFHPEVIETIRSGDRVYRMSDASRIREASGADRGKTPVKGILTSDSNRICIEWTVSDGPSSGLKSASCIAFGTETGEEHKALSSQRCAEQLSKTGGTPFIVSDMIINSEPSVPVSLLNKLRRDSLDKLGNDITASFRKELTVDVPAPLKGSGILYTDDTGPVDIPGWKRNGSLVSAYLYEWDGSLESLECGADIYELPLRSFLKENAFGSVKALLAQYPDTKIAVYLPPASNGVFNAKTGHLLERLSAEGVFALISGDPGNAYVSRSIGLADMRDPGANIFNTEHADLVFRQGAFSAVLSQELGTMRIRDIIANCSGGLFELPVYGRIRLMHSEHCPAGYNREGCRMCHSGRTFRLKDRKGMFMPVVCHPEYCTAEILSPEILCAPEDVLSAAGGEEMICRAYFYDEDIDMRRELIEASRMLLLSRAQGPGSEAKASVKLRSAALSQGIRTGSAVKTGFYGRGIS